MFGKKQTNLSLEDLKKFKKFSLGFIIGISIVWIMILSYMYFNDKPYKVFIGVAIATMIPNFISLMNFSKEIKKRQNK